MRMQERMMQDRRDAGKEGYGKERRGMQERMDAGKEGFMKGGFRKG